MAEDRYFVQFPHRGHEYGPDEDAVKHWDRASPNHGRKFMRCAGAWRRDAGGSAEEPGEILFWGEWEADSLVEPVTDRVTDGPRWVHRPFFTGTGHARRLRQNTDPFVFGERFLYTFCRQPTNGRLRRLGDTSLILFGSRLHTRFVVDTVFVIADHVDHTRSTYRSVAGSLTNDMFAATTLYPMYAVRVTDAARLYRAATAKEPVGGMFSFVPCLPAQDQRTFARPAIQLQGLVRPTLARAARVVPVTSVEKIHEIWKQVVDQILSADLFLGTSVARPGPRDS